MPILERERTYGEVADKLVFYETISIILGVTVYVNSIATLGKPPTRTAPRAMCYVLNSCIAPANSRTTSSAIRRGSSDFA